MLEVRSVCQLCLFQDLRTASPLLLACKIYDVPTSGKVTLNDLSREGYKRNGHLQDQQLQVKALSMLKNLLHRHKEVANVVIQSEVKFPRFSLFSTTHSGGIAAIVIRL